MEIYDIWEMISLSIHVDTINILNFPTTKLKHVRATILDHECNLIDLSSVICANIESELYYE